MDAWGYVADQLQDAVEDFILADQSGRFDEASQRAAQGQETFGYDAWEAAVDRARATSWVGMPGFVGGQA